MNEIQKSLAERKSVRAFEDRDISTQDKQAILQAAMQAPSAGNQQLYTILDITEPALKNRLAETCDQQPFIAKAPLVLIFCADVQKWYDAFLAEGCSPRRPGAGDLLLAVLDSAIAAQNAVVAAQSLGIGSCYIGDILEHCEEHRALLALPEFVLPATMVVFGYPVPQQVARPKPRRCDPAHLVHENRYRHMDAHELRSMLEWKSGAQEYAAWLQAFCKRKYNSAFAAELSRSVEQYLQAYLHR